MAGTRIVGLVVAALGLAWGTASALGVGYPGASGGVASGPASGSASGSVGR